MSAGPSHFLVAPLDPADRELPTLSSLRELNRQLKENRFELHFGDCGWVTVTEVFVSVTVLDTHVCSKLRNKYWQCYRVSIRELHEIRHIISDKILLPDTFQVFALKDRFVFFLQHDDGALP